MNPCIYCGHPATSVDHIHPRSRGGTDEPSNLAPACKSCNSAKGNRPVEWFLREHPVILARVRAYQAGDDVLADLKPGEQPRTVDDWITTTLRLGSSTHDQLREMAFSGRVSQHALLMEALNLLFERHGKPPIAPLNPS